MEPFLEYLVPDSNYITAKEAVCDVALLEIEDAPSKHHKLLVPTCSCDYIKTIAKHEKMKCPDFSNELKPTRIDENDQCQYCGYYACWKKVDIFFFESSAIPNWSQPEWYRKMEDHNWYKKYQLSSR
jgi:hypothetical protein